MIEQYAIRKLCSSASQPSKEMKHLHKIWMVAPEQYLSSLKAMAKIDEDFHCALVQRHWQSRNDQNSPRSQ